MKMNKEHRNTTKRKKEWIPVSKKLPKEGVKVLVWYEYFRYGTYNRLFQTYGLGYVYRGEFAPFINGGKRMAAVKSNCMDAASRRIQGRGVDQ